MVHEAADGVVAIQCIKMQSIDLILLDLHMPGSDGFAVLKYLQEHRPMLPVIILTGMSPHKIQQKIHALPVPELPPLMLKPIILEQLLSLVDLQLSGDLGASSPREEVAAATPSN